MSKAIFTVIGLSCLLCLSVPLFADSLEGTRVLQMSSSKKSIVIDLGYAEGLRNGDRSKLFVMSLEEGLKKPRFTYVAEGEVIKVQNNQSYWFLRKIKNFRLLQKGATLSIVRQAKDPRRPFISRRTLRIQGRADDQKYYQVSEDKGVPDDLIFEEEDFFEGDRLRGTKATKRQDLEITRKKEYVNIGTEYDDKYDQARKRLVAPSERDDENLLKQAKRKRENEVFDSTSVNSVKKYNDLKYGLKGLYSGLVRDPSANVKEGSDFLSVRQRQRIEDQKARDLSPEAIARIKRNGPRWSQDMDDGQLRDYLIETGVEGELRRQQRSLNEKGGSEITIRYTTNLGTNTTELDENYRGTDYALSFAYEWHLSTTLDSLENFTLELELERGISHYDVGGVNGRITEGSLKGYVNWYFWNAPNSLYKYMPYVGLGIKRGNGELESGDFDNIYTYQILGFPSSHIGLKYRFKSGDAKDETLKIGFGLNLQLKYESMRYNVNDILVDDIAASFVSTQTRFSVGFNIYF
jgi:hypothetical protein